MEIDFISGFASAKTKLIEQAAKAARADLQAYGKPIKFIKESSREETNEERKNDIPEDV